jgi:hypothetical protein
MNKSEFNSFSLLEIENEELRGKVKSQEKEIESLKFKLNKILQENEDRRKSLHTEQIGQNIK